MSDTGNRIDIGTTGRRAFLSGLATLPLGGLRQHSFDLLDQYNSTDGLDESVPGLWEQIVDTNERIRALPATTMEGLVAKAEIMRWEVSLVPDRDKPAEDWDWDETCLDGFIRELRAFGRG